MWRDWALVVVAVGGTGIEAMLRSDRVGLPLVVVISLVIALTLPWRRTHPLAAVVVAFGTLIVFDVARIIAIDATGLVSVRPGSCPDRARDHRGRRVAGAGGMRAILGVLRDGTEPDLTPQPGITDIERLTRTDGSPPIDVSLSGVLDDLPQPVGVALFRIAQEALTNTLRHAVDATSVRIELAGDAEQVRLGVRDDGEAVSASRPPSGLGLTGMDERVALLGGTLLTGPGTDGGWVVDATLPKRGAATPDRPQATDNGRRGA